MTGSDRAISYEWRGDFTNTEINALHAEAFSTAVYDESQWDWRDLTARHSLGWVAARRDAGAGQPGAGKHGLVGFVNVLWDGLVHAWLQDTMVAASARGLGIGTELVARARDGAALAGCEWLHVDFDDDLGPFYYGACGFTTISAGLLRLN